MLEKRIEQDLKTALLQGDHPKVQCLRGLKSALLYAKVEKNKRESGLSEAEEIEVLGREAKKRTESAELYLQGGNSERARAELAERTLIEQYLPRQLSEAELREVVNQTISEMGISSPSDMGRVIGAVKQKTAGSADGSLIASVVKESLK